MDVGFRIVDVFTPRPLAGNQLCVVPDPRGLDEATMQALALEIGFSETTYVTGAARDGYAVRIFTPGSELPFAGHPTIGTAFVLAHEGRIGPTATLHVTAGEIPVEVRLDDGVAWMTQFPPVFDDPIAARDLVARAIGLTRDDLVEDLPVRTVSTGLPHTIVPVRDPGAVRRARRDDAAVAAAVALARSESLYLFAPDGDGILARMFDAELGIGEDPATGSAAGPLGAYLAHHGVAGPPAPILVRQGEQVGRPSELHVEVAADDGELRVRVGGGVHLVASGAFTI